MEPTQDNTSPAPADTAPIMDIAPPPTPAAADKPHDIPQDQVTNPEPVKNAATEQPAQPAKPKAPKQPGSGVGLAITATVIIILGLGAIAAYAYMQTAK